jgi:hypothetical protein
MLFVLLAALLAGVCGAGRAHAAGGTYSITAGGSLSWFPETGAINQTSNDKVEATGTMASTAEVSGSEGTADYHIASGPGIVRARVAGSVTVPSGLAYPFDPSLQAVSTTELTVSGPDGFVNTTVNLHVDGFLEIPVCGGRPTCGGESVYVSIGPFVRQSEFNTFGDTRDNSLGLTLDPVPGGYHVHGDVTSATLGVRTNTPYPVTIVLNVSGGYGAAVPATTFGGDFEASFDPTKPVLNDLPAGYTVSGPNVVDNHWTNPFEPPASDVVVTSCATLPQLTHVTGNLVIRNVPGCPTISLPNLTRVDGDLVIEGNEAGSVDLGSLASVAGSVRIDDNGTSTIGIGTAAGNVEVSGDLDITQNAGSAVIDVGNGQIGGDCTIVDNGDAVVDISAGVSGDMTIETGGDSFSGTTAGGATDVTILGGNASMHAVLPDGAFDQPVGFTISRTSDTPPEPGATDDGAPALIDPVLGFRFAFDIATLNADASLTFTVDLSQLDAAGRADLLNAIAAGIGTIAVKGDAPDAAYQAFAQCLDPQTPTSNGCAAIALLNASGQPVGPNENPAFARFEGVAGHFSTYAVARVLVLDTTPPVISVPASLAVDATATTGAKVSYAASAHDDHDPAPSLVCTPASGSVLPIGDTTVSCVATDAAGNAATARFVVHVRGAGEQIVALVDKTLAYLDVPSLKPALRSALQSSADAIVAHNPRAACLALNVYVAAVKLAPTKAFTAAERAALVADATRIRAVIGC